jgi:GTPase SAR1 family protein
VRRESVLLDPLYDEKTIGAIRAVRDGIKALSDCMLLREGQGLDRWGDAVNTRLLPRLMPDYPLVAAICGGGSSGKSTLFNSLIGETVSPVGGRAGINRRLLVSVRSSYRQTPDITESLFEAFGSPPQELTSSDQLTVSGPPLLHFGTTLPRGLALVDTPDFDTGSKGSYRNREMAEHSLRVADILVYIFTNANYNNRDNTDFIARMLTDVGTRNCLLVYRAYPSFTEEEVLEHAGTVARNLYGNQWEQHVLGVFRAMEDNRVADGVRPVTVQSVGAGQTGLMESLTRLDPRKIRGKLHRSVFGDVVEQGNLYSRKAVHSKRHLEVYLDSLQKVQQQCVQEALGHLPMDAVVRRFSEIWQETDPAHVKIMRKTGKLIETPVRLGMRAVKWIGRKTPEFDAATSDNRIAALMEADLIRAANRLRQASLAPAIDLSLADGDPAVPALEDFIRKYGGHVGASHRRVDEKTISFRIPLHSCLEDLQKSLRSKNWSSAIDVLLERQENVVRPSGKLEEELQRLVREQRSKMTTVDQVRQTAAAMLNIIPATAAVTYVLSTGDPVGATGIKVQLAGLFGIKDLYALVAIPATTGMKKADLRQLETLLAPMARTWLTVKLTAIETLFQEMITGPMLEKGRFVVVESAEKIASVKQHLTVCHRALEKRA